MRGFLLPFLFASLFVYRSQDGVFDDEFLDEEQQISENLEPNSNKYNDSVVEAPRKSITAVIMTYGIEVGLISVFISSLIVYYYGLKANMRVIKYFATEFRLWAPMEYKHIDGNCDKIGFFSDCNKSECFLWTTGSQNSKGMLMKICTFPRHSLLRWGMFLISRAHSESINLTIYMDAKSDVRVTVLGRPNNLRADNHLCSLTKISKDFTTLLGDVEGVSRNSLLYFCEAKEFAQIVASALHDILTHYSDAIMYLYISDTVYDSIKQSLKLENDNLLSKSWEEKTPKLGSTRMELSLNPKMFLPDKANEAKYNLGSICEEVLKIVKSLTTKHPKAIGGAVKKEKLSEFRASELTRAQKELHQRIKEESMSRKDQKVREENQRLLLSTDKHDILRLEKNKARREQRKEKKTQRVVMHTAR